VQAGGRERKGLRALSHCVGVCVVGSSLWFSLVSFSLGFSISGEIESGFVEHEHLLICFSDWSTRRLHEAALTLSTSIISVVSQESEHHRSRHSYLAVVIRIS